MGRGRQSHDKRQREKAKQAKQAAKREERAERARMKAEGEDGEEELDEAALHEQFRILNERKAAGEVTDEEFEEEREEIWEKLGLVIQ